MRILFIIAFCYGIILLSSCARIVCSEPVVTAYFDVDSGTMMPYTVTQYPRGNGFSGSHYSWSDTALTDHVKQLELGQNYDWVIEIIETGKRYEISDIHYDGDKRYNDGSLVSEKRHYCTRNIHYTLNGTKHDIIGSVYYYGNNPKEIPRITITK